MERKEVCIQKGNADDDVTRNDKDLNAEGWEDFIVAKDYETALKALVEGINDNTVDTENCFFRIKIDQKRIINL